MTFSIIDVIFILLIIIFAVVATAKGFVKEIFNKASLILGILFASMFCNKLQPLLVKTITNVFLSKVVSFVLIFVIVFLVIQIVKVIVGRIFDSEIMNGLDRTLGFFFGIIEGLAVVMLLLLIMSNFKFLTDGLLKDSFFFNLFAPLLQTSQSAIKKEAA